MAVAKSGANQGPNKMQQYQPGGDTFLPESIDM